MDKRVYSVEVLRGLAALWVAWFHMTTETVPVAGSFGWLGVDVFFVISGFVIPLSLRGADYRVPDFGRFLTRRLVRLEPPYLISIALTIALAYASSTAPGFRGEAPGFTIAQVASHIAYLVPLFDQEWILPIYWTLAYELVFYFTCGLFFPFLFKHSILWALALATIALIPSALSGNVEPRSFEFLIGFAAMRYFVGRDRLWVFLATTALSAGVLFAAEFTPQAIVCGATALIIVFLKIPKLAPLTFLGTISYSLYLIHVPIGGRVVNLGKRFVEGAAVELALSAFAIVVSLAAAYVFYRLIEARAVRWSKRLNRSSAPAAG